MIRGQRFVRVLQHEAGEGPGLVGDALAREGVAIEVTRLDLGQPVPLGLDGAEGLVLLGGAAAVYEADRVPYLADELRLLERALREDVPTLGICLGSQLLAAALGAPVTPAPAPEIGWLPVTRKPAAAADLLFGQLPERFVALHWHGDRFELPAGAVSLAASEQTEHQAFRHGDRAYGLLFHLEATPETVRAMVDASGEALARARVLGAALVDDADRHAAEAAVIAVPLFQRWASLLPG